MKAKVRILPHKSLKKKLMQNWDLTTSACEN